MQVEREVETTHRFTFVGSHQEMDLLNSLLFMAWDDGTYHQPLAEDSEFSKDQVAAQLENWSHQFNQKHVVGD